jgi:hypothetical protein
LGIVELSISPECAPAWSRWSGKRCTFPYAKRRWRRTTLRLQCSSFGKRPTPDQAH